MKRFQQFVLLTLVGLLALLAASQLPAPAGGELPGNPIEGGRIYDNWMVNLDLAAPEGNQPLWGTQDSNPASGPGTWLCTSCHGWDYKGTDGAYGSRSPFHTGFSGLAAMVGASQETVLAWLDGTYNRQHNFTQYFDTTAANDLAAFLRTQQVDLNLIIDPQTGEALGNDEAGQEIYNHACAECHGDTGRGMSFSTGPVETYLGDLAVTDPWRTVHKIRFGLPEGGPMPSTEELGWSLGRVGDLLAYLQTLPRGNLSIPMAQGEPEAGADLRNQGDIQPVTRMGLVILALILIPLAWDSLTHRNGDA